MSTEEAIKYSSTLKYCKDKRVDFSYPGSPSTFPSTKHLHRDSGCLAI